MIIEGTFGDDIDFIIAGDEIVDGTQVRFYKYKVENKPMFDGRFFVKILNDDVFKSIITTREIGDREYKTVAEKKIYFMSGDHKNRHATPAETATFGPNANIKDYYNSVGAQALTAFEDGAASSAGTSGDWFRYETYFKNKYYDDVDDNGLQIGSNGSYHTKSRGEVFEDVMFIDKGVKSGSHGYLPVFRSYAMWAENPSQGIGIVNNNGKRCLIILTLAHLIFMTYKAAKEVSTVAWLRFMINYNLASSFAGKKILIKLFTL